MCSAASHSFVPPLVARQARLRRLALTNVQDLPVRDGSVSKHVNDGDIVPRRIHCVFFKLEAGARGAGGSYCHVRLLCGCELRGGLRHPESKDRARKTIKHRTQNLVSWTPSVPVYLPSVVAFESAKTVAQYRTNASKLRNRLNGGSLRTSRFVSEAAAFCALERDLR